VPTGPLDKLVPQLLQAVVRGQDADFTDEQLLEAFVRRGERPALEALVRRHGPMVWGVCRRVLGDPHDAEDAFQATFLVLVRRAAAVRPSEMVANWLYGVAYRTALKARATTAKRRAREKQVTAMPEPAVAEHDPWDDLRPVLDQELSRLPDKYRAVLLLCDVQGRTRGDVARQQGLPEGTVASRLATARALLAKRLTRRGVTLTAGALATALSQNAAAGVPASVLTSTIQVACLFAAGPAAATGVLSAPVAALTRGVLQAMLLNKLKAVTAGLVALGLVGFGGGLLTRHLAATPSPAQGPATSAGNAAGAPQNDRDRLQGTWRELAYEEEGVRLDERALKDARLIVTGDTLSFVEVRQRYPFELHPAKSPKEIYFGKGGMELFHGIYQLEGDDLKLCYVREGQGLPPTDFTVPKGSRRMLIVLRRENAPPAGGGQGAANGKAASGPPANTGIVADRIQPGDRLRIEATNTLAEAPVKGVFQVEPGGTVNLGPHYGRVRVSGQTLEGAEAVLRDHLGKLVRNTQVSVSRYDPLTDGGPSDLEGRVRKLEEEVRALRAAVERLQKQKGP
jgi:RNA polymerase sigma factor (sigma-70 family)